MIKITLPMLLCFNFLSLFSQKFEWVKFYQGKSVQYLNSTNTDINGNVYLAINYLEELKVDTTVITGSLSYRRVYISRVDSSGEIDWQHNIRAVNSNSIYSIGTILHKNNRWFTFIYSPVAIIFKTDTIRPVSNGDGIYMLEISKAGNLISGRQLFSGTLSSFSYINKNFTSDEQGNFYMSFPISGTANVYDSLGTTNISSGNQNYIFKFSNSGRLLSWIKFLPRNVVTNNISCDVNGNIYLGTFWEGSPNSFNFKNQTISRPQNTSGGVFIFDKNGNEKNWFHILASGGESTVSAVVAHDTTSVFVTGYFRGDSAKFDQTWKKSKSNFYYNFFALYNADGKLIWEKHQDSSGATSYAKRNDYASVINFKNEYLYISHQVYERLLPIAYDGVSYMGPSAYFGQYQYWGMNLKVDIRGNILWGFRTFYPFSSMGVDNSSNLYFGGYFENDSVFFGPFKAKGNSGDGFVGKTYDYAIFRGPVSSGPYCAGDTFKVPYTKVGEFADSNVFYAELSDENGEFTGKQRILGSKQSKDSGTITGQLPMFDVKSSSLYRIRIRSTSPQAQSFYKLDTLKLLIYSRDKALPGPDTLICKGDTLQISAVGGTKWTWSPKYNMQDSSKRETLVWPLATTTYQIIIADSSGCGQADTAFKTVRVRNDLSIQFHTSPDTSACLNGVMPVIASFHGGDSLNYNWQWSARDSKGNYSFPKTGYGKLRDTLLFVMPPAEKDSVQFTLFLSDNCMPKNAFKSFTLKVKKIKSINTVLNRDTALCPGQSNYFKGIFKGSPAAYLSWQWQEKGSSNIWSNRKAGAGKTTDSFLYTLPLNWTTTKQLRLLLKDNCSGLSDTSIYLIQTRDTLSLTLNTKDSVLCKGSSWTWKAKARGGYPDGYRYVWTDINTGDTLSLSDSMKVTASNNRQLKITLHDGCMPDAESITFQLSVLPELLSDILVPQSIDTVICYGHNIKIKGIGSGGRGKAYLHEWLIDNQKTGSTDSFLFDSKSFGIDTGFSKILTYVLSDACTVKSDSSYLKIQVLPELNIEIMGADSICYGNEEIIQAKGYGGKGNYTYQWKDASFILTGSNDTQILRNNFVSGNLTARYAILTDACPEKDTAYKQIQFLPGLKIGIQSNDTCALNSALLSPVVSGGKAGQYRVKWFDDNGFLSESGTYTANPGGQSKIYRAVLEDNCSTPSDTAIIQISTLPDLTLKASGLCLGDETVISFTKNNSFKIQNLNWFVNNNTETETDSILKRKFPQTGKQNIKVIAYSAANCSGKDSIDIQILDKPIAEFTFAHFDAGAAGIQLSFINNSRISDQWLWRFGNGDSSVLKNPVHIFRDTGFADILLIACNQGQCFDTSLVRIPILRNIDFYFPTGFSSDDNGINEWFGLHPGQIPFVTEFHIEIYNRWGEKVFESNNPEERWLANRHQQGVYIYKVDIRDVYNKFHEIKGVVEVLR